METETLPHRLEGEIHLWFAFPGATEGPGEADGPSLPLQGSGMTAFSRPSPTVLDEEEKNRLRRLRDPAGRCLFAASHTLVRRALSHYRAISPEKWRFVRGAQGKPSIAPGIGDPPLAFSLAHTRQAALVAVAEGREIGTDLESGDRRVDAARLSRRFFAPEEDASLVQAGPAGLRELFFHLWTLKESYVKARGLGLLIPLDSFSFQLTGALPRQIGFSGTDPDDRARWRFALLCPRPPYVASVGFPATGPGPVRLRCFHLPASGEVLPLDVSPLAFSPGIEIGRQPASP